MNRVTIAHPHFLKPAGATKVVLELSRQLVSRGIAVTILTTQTNPAVIADYQGIDFQCLSQRTTGSLMFWPTLPFFRRKFQRAVQAAKGDVVFAHSLALYWLGGLKRLNPDVPLVYYLHDLGLPYVDSQAELGSLSLAGRTIGRLIKPILNRINAKLLSQIDAIIANSQQAAVFFERRYQRQPDAVITPGIDAGVFTPTESKGDYLYTAGRLEKIKRTDLVIEAFAAYIKQSGDRQLELHIIGGGIEQDSLQALAKSLGVASRTRFLGVKSAQEVAAVAAGAKAGIFLCPNESFGLAAVESMGCGTPVIGVNRGGIGEIVVDGQTGLLTDLEPVSIGQKIAQLLADKDYPRLCRQARQHVLDHYTWQRSGEELIEFFKKIGGHG